MNVMGKILDRVVVLGVVFTDADNYALSVIECRYRKGVPECEQVRHVADINEARKELSAFPVIVLIGGYGVITKDTTAATDITARVRQPASGFLWNEEGNSISFVRSQQIEKLQEALKTTKAKTVSVRCITFEKEGGDEMLQTAACSSVEKYYAESMRLRTVLKPTEEGSALAWLTASKLKLPVLGVLLLALMVNTMQSSKIQGRHESARVELEAVRKAIGQTDETTRRQQQFLSEYDIAPSHSISIMCDRAAMVLPENILLTSLSVQPPLRSIENNKKTTFTRDQMVITGESQASAPVSDYAAALGGLDFVTKVQLTSIERDRDRDMFLFRIIVDL